MPDVYAAGNSRRRALLIHLTHPFLSPGTDIRHQNRFHSTALAEELGRLKYRVDVTNPGTQLPNGTPPYDVVVDLHPGLTPYPSTSTTRRIAYITGSNPDFSNAAERTRLEAVRRQRGVELLPRRQVQPFAKTDLGICMAMFFLGSQANLDTYSQPWRPPVYFVRNFAYAVDPIDSGSRQPSHFMFLASGGQVHKGLDLLLEVFARKPGLTLHVLSSFHEEADFCRAFRRELFGRANIVPHGFMFLDSARFAGIARMCSHLILPSCSEANAGSVLSGMAAGLRPIVSRECGFSPGEVEHLPDCSLEAIDHAVTQAAARSPAQLADDAARARQVVVELYSPESFISSLRTACTAVIPAARGTPP